MKEIMPEEIIERKIYLIRKKKVMLDRDLAKLYEVKSIRLREQIQRNIRRFPVDFMFRLSREECEHMVSQNAIPSMQHLGGHLPYVFTEHGALMLSSVLNSERAEEIGILIVRTFVKMRELLGPHKNLIRKVDEMELKYDYQFNSVFQAIKALMDEPAKKTGKIGF